MLTRLALWSYGLASELCTVIFASARTRVRGFVMSLSSFDCEFPANSGGQRDIIERIRILMVMLITSLAPGHTTSTRSTVHQKSTIDANLTRRPRTVGRKARQ